MTYLSHNELGIKNHLAVIPLGDFGDKTIMNWNPHQLRPYLSCMLKGKTHDGMFNGLIFNPISIRENHYIYPIYATFGQLADQRDWQLFINNLFMKDNNIHAAAKFGKEIDIWVVLPYPLPHQKSFGLIKDKEINFSKTEDRLLALQWWIITFLKGWKRLSNLYPSLSFRGFVWQREAILDEDYALVKAVNDFIHKYRLLAMWLPNYGSSNLINWRSFSLDIVCINSNYYGNTNHDYSWINQASACAQYYQMGMQINCGKGVIFNEGHLIDYLNLGLPEYNKYIKDCLLVYQFINQSLFEVLNNNLGHYKMIYSFIKGSYRKVAYNGIAY